MNAVKNLSDLLGQIQQNLKCSICLELLSNPVTTRCRHNFCSFCISKFLNTKREVPCPLCKMSITKRSLHTSSELTVVIEGVRRLITAFEDDTGTTSSPAKGVGHSLQQGGVSSTKKTVGRASDSKCRSGNRSNRTDTAGCSTMASTSSSATTLEETALRSSDMTCEDSDCLEAVDGNSIRTGLSSPGDTENGSNGANSCKVRTSSRRALLRYLEEGAISHPDVSNASKSVCAVDEGDGEAIEGKRKPSRDKESKMTGHGVRNVCVEAVTSHFDNEVKPSVEKEQVGRRRQSVHIALNEQSSDSTAMKVHDYTGRETRGGNVGYRNRTKERKMGEVVVPPSEGVNERNDGMNQKDENDSRTGHTTAGYDSNKVLKRTRSTSNNRTGRKREGLSGGDDDGKCTEEKGSDLTGCQVRLDKKTLSVHPDRTRITRDAALSNDVDHDEEKTQARCQGRKKKQSRNCHESENECNGRTEYSGISNVDVRGRDMSSPLSVCSISSTQQLQKSIQPVSRTYSKKMKAAFKESDDNVKWAHTKPTTIHGLNGHAELDPVTNSHDDGASFSSSPRDEKTIKIPPRSIQCQTDEEKQVQADHVDKSEICLSNVACINKNVSQNTVTTGSTTRKNSIFKSKNLSQGQSKSNGPSALSTSDQYEFQGGGTPPTLCDRRERRQKRVSGRKEKNKVMLALDGLEPRTSTRTTLSSCLKKGVVVEQAKECQRVESACDASNTSINLHKRVHFAGAGEHDKVTKCPGKQRDSDVKMQEESGRAKVINIDDENSGVQAVVIDDANQVFQPENIDNDNINLEKDNGHRGMRECKKVENEMRKRHRDNAETTKGKDEMSAETRSGLLSKSTPVIHSRGRQRVRRRKAVSVVEVNKEREVELEKMRSKIHEAEDFEFMFSTQEAHQHIANVNKQDDEKIKNRDFQTAFGFESLEELEDDKEKGICQSDRRMDSCAVTVTADVWKEDCAMVSDAVNSNVVGENETTNPGMAENNREHCNGNTNLEKMGSRNVRSAVCEGKQENQTIGSSDGGNHDARVKSKGADVKGQSLGGHREPHSHVTKIGTSHIVNESNKEGESDVASVSMLQMRSRSSIIKSTAIGQDARAWHPSRKQAAMTHRFARPDVSVMRLFRPDTQLAGTGMFTSENKLGSQCMIRDDVGSSMLKLNPEIQSTRAVVVVDSPSPKVVVETPLSSPLCLSDTSVIKSTNQTVRQAHPLSESPLQSKYRSAKHTTEGELGRETVRKCDLEGPLKTRGRGTERLTLTLNGSKLQTDEGAVQDRGGVEGGSNVEESEDLVTGSAIIAKDTCVDEIDDGEPTQKVCDVIIPDTEFPDAVYLSNSDDAEGHDSGGGEDRDDVQGNWQPGLITQEIGSPSPLSEVKTSKQATDSSQNNNDATINVKSSVNVDDKSTKKTVSGRHSHVKCAMGSLDRRSVKDSQSVHLTGSNNTAGADCGDLHDLSNAESQDVAISSTYTVNHQCPKSGEKGEELVAGRMNGGSMCDDTMAGGHCTELKSFDHNKQDNDDCQSKSHDPGRTHTDQNQAQGEDVSETKTSNVTVSPDANCVLACMESESSQSIFSTTCQASKSNHGHRRQQDQTTNVNMATQHHTQSPQTLQRNSQTANMYDTQNINICSDGDNKVADELEFDENFEVLSESGSKTDKQVLSNTPITKPKDAVENQKMGSLKTPALTSSVSKYENCADEGGVGTRSGRKRHSAGSVLKNQGGRNKKIKTESQQGVRGSAPARLLNIDFFCDSDDENDGVLIVRRSKRKCLSLDSVPLQPIVFGSDLVNEPASDGDKHDALTTMTSSSTPKKAFVNDEAFSINNDDSISNIALNASACNTSEKSVVQETAESTIPPTMDENQDEGDSATNGTPPSDVDNTAATVLTRKTRRGFARKDNAFHKKPLVSLPDSVLPQNVKAAILKEFTSQSGEESNKSLDGCGEKGKTPVSEFGQEKSCQLSDENSKESQNIDTTSVGESNLSEESSQQVLENDKYVDLNKPATDKESHYLQELTNVETQREFESPKSKPGTVTGQTCEGNLETSTRAILSSTTKALGFENTATTGTVDDKAILISSQQSPSQGETHQGSKPSDEDKKRLENELFGELPQNEPATDTDSELEDIHLNIQLTPSGGSASSQGSSQGSWCTPNVTEKLSNLPVKVSDPTDDVFDGNGEGCNDGEDAVASESEEMIMPTKKRKRRMITSDSEDHGDTDSDLTNNNSEINNTSSSALSSQSEVISTQQRDALEREVQELQQKIAMCEAALNGSSREEKASSSSSNPASNVENDDAVETTPEPIAKGGAEYGDDGDKSIVNENDEEGMVSDNDDLFILPPSPSPPEKPPSRPPPVSSRPALSSSSGIASKTSNDFVKRFKSPGGSLHKRRPLFDFTRVSDSAEMSQTAEWDRKNVENEQDQIVIDDSQNDCDIDEGATVEMEAQPELENDNSFDGSQSPVIFSLGSKDRKKASSHSSQDVMPPSNKKNCVIVASGLNGQELQLVHKLTNTLPNVRLGNRVLTDVTHVIMKTAPGREMVCDRTLKYFQAIARRLWIVSLQWITASLQAGELLPERDFEIQGDTSGGDRTQGPERARLSKQKIFDNYCFACFGNSPELPRDNMEELLTLCGASFVQDLIALPSSTCDNKIIICCTDVDLTSIEKAMLKGVYESTGVVSVKRDWVLDSVSSYKIFPLDDYLLLTNKPGRYQLKQRISGRYQLKQRISSLRGQAKWRDSFVTQKKQHVT